MDLQLSPKLVVREAMSSPVIDTKENSTIVETSKLMQKNRVGAIIILKEDDKPVGIVTERDIVNRVVAEGHDPKEILAKHIMSSPLRVVNAETSLLEAISLMDKKGIRRLGVNYKDKLVGIVTDRDILRLMPTIVEIEKERSKINNTKRGASPSTIGYCDRCESYSRDLRPVEGQFLCEECRADIQ
jgi:signal-transduction protein with cAMP-binding, CBS, and nucleotidyltransferase domain